MDKTVFLQKQIRDNVDDVQNFMRDLSNWEKDMKRKEMVSKTHESNQHIAPIRKKKKNSDTKSGDSKVSATFTSLPKRIPSYDYAAWEKLDVRTASQLIKFWDNEKTKRKRILANTKRKPLLCQDYSEAILGPQFSGIENADINVFLETSVETNVNGIQNNHIEYLALEDQKRFDDSRFQPDKELERNIDEMSVATCKAVPMFEFDPSTKSSIPPSENEDNPAFAASPSTTNTLKSDNAYEKKRASILRNEAEKRELESKISAERKELQRLHEEEMNNLRQEEMKIKVLIAKKDLKLKEKQLELEIKKIESFIEKEKFERAKETIELDILKKKLL